MFHRRLSSFIFLILQLFLVAGPVGIYAADNAARQSTATLRVGKHANYLRLVFEISESYVQNASVSLSGSNSIKVDFQSPVSIRVPRRDDPKSFVWMETSKGSSYEIDKGLKITAGVSGCAIFVDNLDDINVSKLSSPSRLVIDAFISQGSPVPVEKSSVEAPLSDPEPSEIKVDSFVIDAGHGGYESGVRFAKSAEKDLALSFAKELGGYLARKGKKVALTRKSDQMVSLKDRAKIVNKKSPELMLSIHFSSKDELAVYSLSKAGVKTAGSAGAAVGEPDVSDRSEAVAKAIAESARSALKINVRTEKMPLRLLSYVHVPAVLIELPSPDKFSYAGKSKEQMIIIIVQGIAYSSSGQVGT